MDTAQVLDHAADIIDRHGHHRGAYRGPGGTCCVTAAVLLAEGNPYPPAVPMLALYADRPLRALARHLAIDDLVKIFWWNDDPGRTQVEVTAALRETAGLVREGQIPG